MTQKERFANECIKEVDNKSIYVWGGQGEKTSSLSIAILERMETDKNNVKRVLGYINTIYDKNTGIPANSRAFDCSGLVTYTLMKMGLLTYDTTADGLYKRCKPITKKELQKGDLVFKVKNDRASHVGVYIGDGKLVEAYGRDKGVCISELTSSFNKFGVYPKFI